jgi:hypothetical protein
MVETKPGATRGKGRSLRYSRFLDARPPTSSPHRALEGYWNRHVIQWQRGRPTRQANKCMHNIPDVYPSTTRLHAGHFPSKTPTRTMDDLSSPRDVTRCTLFPSALLGSCRDPMSALVFPGLGLWSLHTLAGHTHSAEATRFTSHLNSSSGTCSYIPGEDSARATILQNLTYLVNSPAAMDSATIGVLQQYGCTKAEWDPCIASTGPVAAARYCMQCNLPMRARDRRYAGPFRDLGMELGCLHDGLTVCEMSETSQSDLMSPGRLCGSC